MKIGIDGRIIPEAAIRGPIDGLAYGKCLGLAGLFYRTVLDMSPTLDLGELWALRSPAGELGMYVEAGLGKVNPFTSAEALEIQRTRDGDILLGFRRMMEACAEIGCRDLRTATANFKGNLYRGRFAYDRFPTDVTWAEQLEATRIFLLQIAPMARDLGVHVNIETHEEITIFELLRLIEAVGDDVIGVVLDTLNPMQRGEHPVLAAKRVAPFLRQTQKRNAYLACADGSLIIQARACGEGAIDFCGILTDLARFEPDQNLFLEYAIPRDPTVVPRPTIIDVFDPDWPAGHPALSAAEYAQFIELVYEYGKRIAESDVQAFKAFNSEPILYDEACAAIRCSAGYLRAVCTEGA